MVELVPNHLDWIRIRRVRRQPFELEPGCSSAGQTLLDDAAAVNGRAIPDHEDLARNLLQQMLKNAYHCVTPIGAPLHPHQPSSLDRQRSKSRDMIAGQRHPENGRLPARRIGADLRGQQVEARLVYPDDGWSLGGSVF